jgi:hypothetical protein
VDILNSRIHTNDIKKGRLGRACGAHGGEQKGIQGCGRDKEHLGVEGRDSSKMDSKEMGKVGVGLI